MKRALALIAVGTIASCLLPSVDLKEQTTNGGAGGNDSPLGGAAAQATAGKVGLGGSTDGGVGGDDAGAQSGGGMSTGGAEGGGANGGSTSTSGAANGGGAGAAAGGSSGGGAGGSSGHGAGGSSGGGVGGMVSGAGGGGAGGGASGAANGGGAGSTYTSAMVMRGTAIVRGIALCGGCHTASGGTELGGNPDFKKGTTPLPAPNLTPDSTGLGDWTDAEIMNAFRNGIDDEGRHLDPVMPYWLFHNMNDADALAVVAFLRSLPKVNATVGATNPDAATVIPLPPSAFPSSSLASTDANYAAAQTGRYLVTGVAQCVKCHSPSTGGLPSGSFLSGVAPANNASIFASNITPDASGLSGWSADDVAIALKVGKNKDNVMLCGSMPSGVKGYGNLSDTDAHAIGVYLTTIPAVSNAAAAPSLEPACP